jgi:3'-phosphoadenosine 5'-phosphosulfate sulfotransferase (PAPS reductase)/FAD synthetase
MEMVVFFPRVRDMVHRHWLEKYATTIGIIDTMLLKYHPRQQMIAWSGGKDSTAVLYLVKKECEDFGIDFQSVTVSGPPLYPLVAGRIEYPETYAFVRMVVDQLGLNYHEEISPVSFWEFVAANGLPGARGDRKHKASNCCYTLKILPMLSAMRELGTKVVYLGTTAPESHQRQMKAIQLGHTHLIKKWGVTQCLPILYWTEAEVWKFTREENIPYNGIYERGATRCGCATCTAYKGWERDMSRLVPELYEMVKNSAGNLISHGISLGG